MRPKAIVTFERLFLASIVLSTVQLAMLAGARIGGTESIVTLVVSAVVILLSVVLVLLVSRRRSNVARWVLAAITVLGLAAGGFSVGRILADGDGVDSAQIVDLIAIALQTAAVAMLFTRDGRGWFERRDVAATE